MKTKLFTLLLVVTASIGSMFAWEYERVQIGDLYYNLDATNQTAEVTSQNSSFPYWSITITTANIPVSVTYNNVEYSVTSIGSSAFEACGMLSSMSIPASVTNIGSSAFYGCSDLTSMTIPSSVSSIGDNAFAYCSGLTSIYVDSENSNYSSEDGVLFNKDKTTLLVCPGGKQGAYTIPSSVIRIGDYAFANCRVLDSVTIPNSVTSIGVGAFFYCSLTSVTIPNSVTSIGDMAFRECKILTSIEIPNSVTNFGDYVFSGCINLPVENNIRYADTYLVGAVDKSLSSYSIKEETRWIGAGAFRYCNNMTSVTIPDNVTNIGTQAFADCSGLSSVTIGNSVTIIGEGVFQNCSSLTSVAIPNGVTSIGIQAFENCSGLTSVTIPNSVTSIGWNAFQGCTGLTSVEAPAMFFDIQETAWPNYTKILNHITINNGELSENALLFIDRSYKTLRTLDVSGVTNTEFVDEAFKGYYNLLELVLPTGLLQISYMMVAECKNLQSIAIPAYVVEIDQSAFENCRSMASVEFLGDALTRIGNWAFYNCHALANIEIPAGVTEIGAGAFYGCTYLNNLSMPASVQSIGDNAFALCSKISQMDVDAVEPPAVEDKTFYEVSTEAPVYVPDESVTTYKAHPVWGRLNINGKSQSPTGIDNTDVNTKVNAVKILRDGQIFIIRGEKVYSLDGRLVR